MSYQVIARKWRPQTFEEVTGQESITHTLRNAVEHDRLHHAYLFSGARGVGKTTTARLLAKALNCHSSDQPVATSCNICASCKEIAEGRSIDVLEFDAASNTQVDKIRDLIIENINIAPARDRYKIFIIDEVHMLSTSSFNALLKTLEEPPPNIVFVMATTELHKVPVTILSRCQEFEFRTIATAKIFDRLNMIAEAEGVTVTAEALREIARSGEGSMRDAQSNFDQVISFSEDKIGIEQVITALGIASSEILTKTIESIAHHRPQDALAVVGELTRRGQDLRNFCRDLLGFIRDLLVAKVVTNTEGLLDTSILDHDALKKHAEHFSESDLIRLFNSLSETETKLRNATQPRQILEIGLVKLMEMKRVTAIETILERLSKLEHLLTANQTGAADTQAPIAEKKTLKIAEPPAPTPTLVERLTGQSASAPVSEPPPADTPFPVKTSVFGSPDDEPPFSFDEFQPVYSDTEPVTPTVEVSKPPVNFYDSLPVRLPDISSEDLEHIDDTKLDAAFEDRLAREGDHLRTIPLASELVRAALNFDSAADADTAAAANSAPRSKSNFKIPEFAAAGESGEIPTLPENPTEEDLLQHAENHPAVKRALRIFRGKIVKVS